MDTLKPLLLVASISISYLYVESLDCQNGTRKVLLGRDAELENTLELIACPTNMPQSCVRFEIKSEHPHGQTNLEGKSFFVVRSCVTHGLSREGGPRHSLHALVQ